MNAYVAATDNDWFRFLSERDGVDEVNFWSPEPWGGRFGVLSDGQPLLSFFWPREMWIEDPPGWHPNIQRGRTYDLPADEDGRRLWELVVERMELLKERAAEPAAVAELPGGFTDPRPVRHRLGQGTFRALITDLYGRRCAVTREKALPALEAAHIRAYADRPRHEVTNGLLLRSDVHRLFDAGYVTVTPEYRVEASRRMKDDFDDGDSYLKLHGARVAVPDREEWRPAAEALLWHNERVYRG